MSKPPVTIHDAFFKQILDEPALAGRFLREHLPVDLAALLGPEPPEQVPGSFVDEELLCRGRHNSSYADVRIMPTFAAKPAWEADIAGKEAA